MTPQTRFIDRTKPNWLLRTKVLAPLPMIYRFGEGFLWDTRKSQAIGKIFIQNNSKYRVLGLASKVRINEKIYNRYLLEKLNEKASDKGR